MKTNMTRWTKSASLKPPYKGFSPPKIPKNVRLSAPCFCPHSKFYATVCVFFMLRIQSTPCWSPLIPAVIGTQKVMTNINVFALLTTMMITEMTKMMMITPTANLSQHLDFFLWATQPYTHTQWERKKNKKKNSFVLTIRQPFFM